MSAEENKLKVKLIMTYGVAILLIVLAILIFFGTIILIFFGTFEKNKPQDTPDIVIDSEPELQDICNKLVVDNEVYPFLEVMGNGLRKANDAQFVAYKSLAELRSDLEIFNVDDLILCGVPIELCYTENNDIKGGTYCVMMLLEVPVIYEDFGRWHQKVSGG